MEEEKKICARCNREKLLIKFPFRYANSGKRKETRENTCNSCKKRGTRINRSIASGKLYKPRFDLDGNRIIYIKPIKPIRIKVVKIKIIKPKVYKFPKIHKCPRCGKELKAIECGIHRMPRTFKNGNTKIYTEFRPGLCTTCKSTSVLSPEERIEKSIRTHLKHRALPEVRKKRNADKAAYWNRHPEKLKQKQSKKCKRNSDNLTYSYVRCVWNQNFKIHGLIPPEFNNEIWLQETIRLSAVRKLREINKLLKNETIKSRRKGCS